MLNRDYDGSYCGTHANVERARARAKRRREEEIRRPVLTRRQLMSWGRPWLVVRAKRNTEIGFIFVEVERSVEHLTSENYHMKMAAKSVLGPLFLLSPAKALDMNVCALDVAKGYTQPQLLQQTKTLVEVRLWPLTKLARLSSSSSSFLSSFFASHCFLPVFFSVNLVRRMENKREEGKEKGGD